MTLCGSHAQPTSAVILGLNNESKYYQNVQELQFVDKAKMCKCTLNLYIEFTDPKKRDSFERKLKW